MKTSKYETDGAFLIKLHRALRNGERRKLTPSERDQIRSYKTNVYPSISEAWQLERSDSGHYCLQVTLRDGTGATWAVESAHC